MGDAGWILLPVLPRGAGTKASVYYFRKSLAVTGTKRFTATVVAVVVVASYCFGRKQERKSSKNRTEER
jgi:hypothetical protein